MIVVFLTHLTWKDHPFSWGVEINAFQSLNVSFITTPLLIGIVDFSKPFVLNIDTFNFALGAMFSQLGHDNLLHLFDFHYCKFFFVEINDKEHSLQENVIILKVQLD
jgi:hypothetical protein